MNIFLPAAAVLSLMVLAAIFNHLIGKRNQVEFALSSLSAQLKRRFDLIPNLVSVCEKYMGYEARVLQTLTLTRATGQDPDAAQSATVDRQISAQLRSILAVAENYPALRAEDAFNLLQRSLNEVEEQLVASRRAYNASVMAFNNAYQMFPTNLFAAALGFRPRSMFEIDSAEQLPTRVWR
jgi:LemA protein